MDDALADRLAIRELIGAEVERLYARGASWLAGGSLG